MKQMQTQMTTGTDTKFIAGDTVNLFTTVKTKSENGEIVNADVNGTTMFFMLSKVNEESTKVLQKECEYLGDSMFKVTLTHDDTENLTGFYTHQWLLDTGEERLKRTMGTLLIKRAIPFTEEI